MHYIASPSKKEAPQGPPSGPNPAAADGLDVELADVPAGEQLLAFCGVLFAAGDIVEFRLIDAERQTESRWCRADSVARALPWLTMRNVEGWNVYAGLNPRSAKGARGDEAVPLARTVFVDIDDSALVHADILSRVESAGLPPATMIVASGHGWWVFWKLAEPITDMALWRRMQESLIARLGGDRTVKNPERIGRVPGFVNWKPPAIRAYLAEVDPNRVYDAAMFVPAEPAAKAAPAPGKATPGGPVHSGASALMRFSAYVNAMPDAVSGGGAGERIMFQMLCESHRFGLSEADAWPIIWTYNNTRCFRNTGEVWAWDEADLRRQLARAKLEVEHAGECGVHLREVRPAQSKSATAVAAVGVMPAIAPRRHNSTSKLETFLDAKRPLDSARSFRGSLQTMEGDDVLRYFRGEWFLWEGATYRRVEDDVLRKMLYQWTEQCFTRGMNGDTPFVPNSKRINEILDALRAEALIENTFAPPTWLDGRKVNPRECIAFQNGIMHLPTYVDRGERFFEPATPLYFATCALPFIHTPEVAAISAWLKFLDEIFDGDADAIALLQQWFGYCLTCDARQQKMLLIYGPKRGGKGTIARILIALLGEQNVADPTLSSLCTNFGLWPLIHATLAIVGDARLSGRTDQSIITERLLSISGEDSLTIDRKNREPVTLRLRTRLMFLTNELPKLSDASGALASRFLILRLKRSWLGCEDLTLEDRLIRELPGILQWAIGGWKELRAQGRFTVPASSAAVVRELDELASPIMAFVRETCTIAPGRQVERDLLYQAWVDWSTGEGREHKGTKPSFGRDLAAAFPNVTTTQPRIGGNRVRFYQGIGLGVDMELQGGTQ